MRVLAAIRPHSMAASRLALGAISIRLGEAASAAWAKLSPCREQEPGHPSIFLQAYFEVGSSAGLLHYCESSLFLPSKDQPSWTKRRL